MACKPLSAMTLSSLRAGPPGRVLPCSHLRTVEAVVCRWSANTGWLNFKASRRRLMSAAPNARTGWRADRVELAHRHLADCAHFVERGQVAT